jgi:hypothetical protein
MLRVPTIVLTGLLLVSPCRADHITVKLKVTVGKASLSAATETAAVGAKEKERRVLRVKAGRPIFFEWALKNVDAKKAVKDVRVHFFVVKEKELGQKTRPRLDKDVAAENVQVVDFNPDEGAKGNLLIPIDKPGPYLVRVETYGAAVGNEGHEHFAALELLVQE